MLVSFASPSGEMGKGSVDNVEVMRIAMTHATFKEFVSLFNYTLGELGMGPPAPAPIPPTANESHKPHEASRRFERSRPRQVPEKAPEKT